jgi:hypothetical protein
MDNIHYEPLLNVNIEGKARRNRYIKKHFKGVFSADTLPKVGEKPFSLIVNTHCSSQPGEHWVAMFRPKTGPLEYFDSFGRPPYVHEHIVFIQKNSFSFIYNETSLQSRESSMCGHYCLLYLQHRSSNKSMKNFVSDFNMRNPYNNDAKVMLMFRRLFGTVRTLSGRGQVPICCVPRHACAIECLLKN